MRGPTNRLPTDVELVVDSRERAPLPAAKATMTGRRQHALVELLIHSTMAPEELSDVQKSADNHNELL